VVPSGPLAQAWLNPNSPDFYRQADIDMGAQRTYNNVVWEAEEPLRQEHDHQAAWNDEGGGGAAPQGWRPPERSTFPGMGDRLGTTGRAVVELVAGLPRVTGLLGGATAVPDLVTVYRGTMRTAELEVFGETGHVLSDAALTAFKEGGTLGDAYSTAGATHGGWLRIFSDEAAYAEAHGAMGTELSSTYGMGRTLISVTTAPAVAARFAGSNGVVLRAIVARSALLQQTLAGASEGEYFLRLGSDAFTAP
jgi:hypothetical protein